MAERRKCSPIPTWCGLTSVTATSSGRPSMLRAEHISVAYGVHRALEDVSVRVEPGEVCVILGANGAGKSTLLKAIAGLVHPQVGATIRVGDEELTGMAAN